MKLSRVQVIKEETHYAQSCSLDSQSALVFPRMTPFLELPTININRV